MHLGHPYRRAMSEPALPKSADLLAPHPTLCRYYDVPEELFADLVNAGVTVVPSRELLRRLRAGGLRLSPADRRAGR